MLTAEKKYAIDRMNSTSIKHALGTELHKTKNSVKCTYDFTVQGGAIGSINLLDEDGVAVTIPSGAIITRTLIYVPVACTSGGSATIAVKSKSAADLKAATAYTSFTLAALLDGVPANTAATSIVMTADTIPAITIAVAALTAGKINVFIEYVLTA